MARVQEEGSDTQEEGPDTFGATPGVPKISFSSSSGFVCPHSTQGCP